MAKTQPATYCKLLGLLVPREQKVEHTNRLGELSDEQLDAMIEELDQRLEARANGAKVIENEAPELPALPAPKHTRSNLVLEAADTAVVPATSRYSKAKRKQGLG